MNAAELSNNEAFNPGSDLWVIRNNPENKWWNELDFRSGFLLSQCLFHHKKTQPVQLEEILQQTELKKITFTEDPNFLLVGSSDHFLNKWILLWDQETEKVIDQIERISSQLKAPSVRFFSDSKELLSLIKARQKTSLTDITFIENT